MTALTIECLVYLTLGCVAVAFCSAAFAAVYLLAGLVWDDAKYRRQRRASQGGPR